MDLSFDWVIGMKLVIPFFRLEFDARQLLVKRFGEIPPSGDFGDFLWLFWLFSTPALVTFLADKGISIVHILRYSLV